MKLGHGPSKEDTVRWQRILNAKGWAGLSWPQQWGGPGWTAIQKMIFLEENQMAPAPELSSFNITMIGPVLLQFGTEEQKQRFLPRAANLDDWWCQGFSEPGAGSDLASLKTAAKLDGDHYVVNGQKIWTSTAHHADWCFVLVRTNPNARKRQEGISFLLVDMKAPGITVRPIISIDGSHHLNEVFFDDVRVPVANRVGEENRGWDVAKFLLGNERTGVAGTGIIKARIARLKKVAAETTSHGRPLLEDPLFRARLTRLEVETTALTMSVLRVLANEAKHPGKPDPVSSVLKLRGSELQQEASELLVDVLGPAALGYRETAKVSEGFAALPDGAVDAMPTYFNWRKASIYSGSSEVQRSIISRAILKF
jgi:alkylation response protein AidB-like acyl-CoA dehydrogenase